MPSALVTGSSIRMPSALAAVFTLVRSPVRPMKSLPIESSQARSTCGVSRCGSVETNTTSTFCRSSGASFFIATPMSPMVVGQTSGQLV